MTYNWQPDQCKSALAFQQAVWPVIREECGGGSVQPVENRRHGDRLPDITGGIDYWQLTGAPEITRGLASRCQWITGKPYNSFTVRFGRHSGADTEYATRVAALRQDGAIYPWWTVQAYFDQNTDRLLAVGIIQTKNLFEYIEKRGGAKAFSLRFNRDGSSDFFAVFWRDLQLARVPMTEINDPPQSPRADVPPRSRSLLKKDGATTLYPY